MRGLCELGFTTIGALFSASTISAFHVIHHVHVPKNRRIHVTPARYTAGADTRVPVTTTFATINESEWTDEDFWAAEEARQARGIGGDVVTVPAGVSSSSDDNNEIFESDIQAAAKARIKAERQKDLESDDMAAKRKPSAWDKMHPLARLKLIEKRQQRAIANKAKNESSQDKKRRLMMTYKQLKVRRDKDRKRELRVKRFLPLFEESDDGEKVMFSGRVLLTELEAGQERKGMIISMANYGVFVDIGSSRDALLHIKDMKDDQFVEHPSELFSLGDEVSVKIKYVDAKNNKLAVSMVPFETESEGDEDDEDLIKIDEIEVDDELWGIVKRVTNYGAYVNLGAEVDGFLHFMDHPDFGINRGEHPSNYLESGQRVRVWVSNVDSDLRRIKLTGNRPTSLPIIRRALHFTDRN